MPTNEPQRVGSILHGAYGDYYWQAVALKLLKLSQPSLKLRIYFAAQARFVGLSDLDLSFADSVGLWTELLEKCDLDCFHQYQIFDLDLRKDVLEKLPESVLAKFDFSRNRLYVGEISRNYPLARKTLLGLTIPGRARLAQVMASYSLSDQMFASRVTVGFVWRYRNPSSYVKPFLQPSQDALVEKYSSVFRKLSDTFGCHFLITGMNLSDPAGKRELTDNKYLPRALDLPNDRVTYLQAVSWALDAEIMSKCNVVCGHPSGFTEVVHALRDDPFILLDPPVHYLMILLRRRMKHFDYWTPPVFAWCWSQPHSAARIYDKLAKRLDASVARRSVA